MQVVLTKRVKTLGNENAVVNVKPGYFRNFLAPQNLAILATAATLKRAEGRKADMVQKVEDMLGNAKELADKLKGVTLTFTKKARGEKLYGSIAEKDIVEALAQQAKLEIGKDMVKMDEHLKDLGEHTVKLHLAEDTDAEVKVMIEKEA